MGTEKGKVVHDKRTLEEYVVLEQYGPIKEMLQLIIVDTRNTLVLGTRKPDFVSFQKIHF